ncbi:YgfZ/GcvT domain-containing protein [Roseospira visakhapatnamensis]|uniref:CAF17 C-terminal domain-containing protein n=1 Tax=Roseospira visakhapatnamensis TaxID=390880 RepID=A0A7W6RAW8_9PROT|nr:folate-binding protein YgfZ [Roseospira visakhapatnamensis]MBB4264554.1 hypothetical protein [Roseospira visakhapatnamensis]
MSAPTETAAVPAPPWGRVLDTRGVLTLAGPDRVPFLQGLVSNDVTRAGPDRALFAALLTPQGKMLFDLMLVGVSGAGDGDGLLLVEAEAARLDELRARLSKYRLRSKVTLTGVGVGAVGWVVAVVFGEGALAALDLPAEAGAARALPGGGVAFVDPRLTAAGARLILPGDRARRVLEDLGARPAESAVWERHRLALGLPEGAPDIGVEKSLPLECGLEELAGVDFRKGCYMGQELTARTKYRGLLKRRLMPVEVSGPLPAPGAPLTTAAGKDAGEMRSGVALDAASGLGLAIVRLEALADGRPLEAGAARLTPRVPDWMVLPEPSGVTG